VSDQLHLFAALPFHRDRRESPFRSLDNGHADTDPPADLRARFAKPCQCGRGAIGDGDPDDDGTATCLRCGRTQSTTTNGTDQPNNQGERESHADSFAEEDA
jgi:hypothetical protein